MKVKERILNLFKSTFKNGIIGIGISSIFFLTFYGMMFGEADVYVVKIITGLIFLLFGYIVGNMIPISDFLFHLVLSKIMPGRKDSLPVSLIISFLIGTFTFYLCFYLFILFINLFVTLRINYMFFISMAVGVISVMIHMFYNYYEEVNRKVILEKENKKLAVMEERNRIARELHDSVSQNLFGISLNLNTLPSLINSDNEKANAMILQLQEMVQEVQTEMRLMIYELRPLNFQDKDFFESIEEMISLYKKRYKSNIVSSLTGDESRVSEKIQLVLYRVLQESLNNVVKHAEAKQVIVSINIVQDQVKMIVEDNGKGFEDTETDSTKHYGIKGMMERLEEVGGDLQIESKKGEGTKVVVKL